MDLWIRSQNREKLVSVHEINLYDKNIIKNDFILYGDPEHYDISIIANDNYNLGTYKTRERALEVLDEIQDIVRLKQAWQLDENSFQICIKKGGYDEEQVVALMNMMYVYEMPSE